jgi:hypothetical protein
MPDGVVQWFDPATGIGRIVHSGHSYACAAGDMAPGARAAGARVHFDIDRDGTHAVAVTARTGRRTRRAHHGAGSLAGAHAPWSKMAEPPTTATLELRRVDRTRPMHLARAWSDAIARGGLDDAVLLYAPDADVRDGDRTARGHREIARVLEAMPVFGREQPADELEGGADGVTVRWAERAGRPAVTAHLGIAHGEITSHRTGGEEGAVAAGTAFPIQVSTHGRVGRLAVEHAVDAIRRVSQLVDEPVLFARVKLTRRADPAARRPCIAEAALDVNGDVVRAHVAADEMRDVVDLLDARLRDRLAHHKEHRDWIRPDLVAPEAGEWRHGNLPTQRPAFFERPADEREIVRHKTWTPEESTVDEAVCDLESLDVDFLLFRELVTGQDSVVSRAGDGTYRLRQGEPDASALAQTVSAVTLDERPAPRATLAEARRRFELTDEPFVFFRDASSGRGHALYRRYDGHDGLVAPAG